MIVPASPDVKCSLDPGFLPIAAARSAFLDQAEAENGRRVALALEQPDGNISRIDTRLRANAHDARNLHHLERLLKTMLYRYGGATLYTDAPTELVRKLQQHYAESATGRFDADMVARRGFLSDLRIVETKDVPVANVKVRNLGGHLDGCRIGFDLGASDRKAAAVIDGNVIFSEEIVWNPSSQTDPAWHYDQINDSLRRVAAHLPRVDAIGGSAAGGYVDNEVRFASLFRGIPDENQDRLRRLFLDLRDEWGVPLELLNDGEVTALAGAMSIGDNAVLGIAMGSSQAGGYVDPAGNLTPWIDELAFVAVDANPDAPVDEWSGDRGCGVQYFSQQAVARLVEPAGIEVTAGTPMPEILKRVQDLMESGDERAARIYQTIGLYLGHTIPTYAEFYAFRHLFLLGRVMSGRGGTIISDTARAVLESEYPNLAESITFHEPDETFKRHGQAIAAASLPEIPK